MKLSTFYILNEIKKLLGSSTAHALTADQKRRLSKHARITVRRRLRDVMFIIFGVVSAGFGLKSFLIPNGFIDGGVTGISLLTNTQTHIPLSILIIVLNVPFMIIAWKQISPVFSIKSVIAITLLAIAVFIIPYPKITDDKLLVSVFGGFFLGAGIGLITGDAAWECNGIIVCLDATIEVIKEAKEKNCNLIVAHHPIVFHGLKKINGKNYVEKAIIFAIKNDICIYAIHTNLDNVFEGVNGRITALLGLEKTRVLTYKENTLKKLYTFVPVENAAQVRSAIFAVGGGNIGQYSQCSFNVDGTGTFKPKPGADPFIGEVGELTFTKEIKIEIIFPAWHQKEIIKALFESHPYEEVAFDIISLDNQYQNVGSGMMGELRTEMNERDFLTLLKDVFKVPVIKHTALTGKPVKKVAVCGGAGSFLIPKALAAGADFYVTSDVKYHEFFDAEGIMVIADIGHFESEQFTIDLLHEILEEKFPTFAVLKTDVATNPVRYF